MRDTNRQIRSATIALLTCLVIAVVAGAGLGVVAADDHGSGEPENLPPTYYGTIEVDGEPAPVGTTIEAVIDGERRGEITVEVAGEYGGDGRADDTLLQVDGERSADEGAEIEFHVYRPDLDRTLADQTATWESGGVKRELDLTVGDSSGGSGGSSGGVSPPSDPDDGDDDDENASSLVLATIDVDPESPSVGEAVTLSAASSTAEESIAAYEWTIEGETVGDAEEITTSFDEAGEYEIRLTVEDEQGETDDRTVTLTVGDEGDDGGSDGDDGLPGMTAVTAGLAVLTATAALARRSGDE